ncbi:MAG TPA: acylneuraminate cytidylyltransferase family protein [Allosphingosinicella sp.]|uniref:acylneuraminate cytidylyltransferase family protein n=1 Tax=Allosphingosinicella sp. TaxID=2823234 RepID=UPI002EDB11A1
MIDGRRALAIVPARRGSKGLPLKNIRPLGGKPLLAWPVEAACASTLVDRVIVSTDDGEFAEIAKRHGADAPFLRPAELASDTAPSLGYILHAIDTLEQAGDSYHYVVILEPTSPLTDADDIDAALRALDAARDSADSLVGITALETIHPVFMVKRDENGIITPLQSESFGVLPRRQDLEPVYSLDGSIYISTVEGVRREQGFCHARTIGFPMPRYKSFEVDDLVDFICIDAIWRNLEAIRGGEPDPNH